MFASGSEKNNLIESTGSAACGLVKGTNGDKTGIDPKLGPLGYQGGVNSVFPLVLGSPAIDAGDNSTCTAAPVSNLDQRGSPRTEDGDGNGTVECDMGSYEAPGVATPTSTTTATTTSTPIPSVTPTASSTPCAGKPAAVTLLKPAQNATMSKTKVAFDWADAACATSYKITVKNTTARTKVTKTVTVSKAKLTLAHGNEKWFVQACNANGCTKSATFKFTN